MHFFSCQGPPQFNFLKLHLICSATILSCPPTAALLCEQDQATCPEPACQRFQPRSERQLLAGLSEGPTHLCSTPSQLPPPAPLLTGLHGQSDFSLISYSSSLTFPLSPPLKQGGRSGLAHISASCTALPSSSSQTWGVRVKAHSRNALLNFQEKNNCSFFLPGKTRGKDIAWGLV